MLHEAIDLGQFCCSKVAPLAGRQVERHIHDAGALERNDLIAKVFTHSSDLPIETLGENDLEHEPPELLYMALAGHGVEDRDTIAHIVNESLGDRLVHRDDILFFVVVAGPQNLVHDVAIVGEEDEPFAGLIESPDGEDPRGVVEVVDDVVGFHTCVGGADNAHRLVKCQINRLFDWRGDALAIHPHLIVGSDFGSQLRHLAINGDAALLNELVGSPAGAVACLGEIFVDSGQLVAFHLFYSFGCKITIKAGLPPISIKHLP